MTCAPVITRTTYGGLPPGDRGSARHARLRHLAGLTVAVTGATGNVGTALLRRLTDPAAAWPRCAGSPGAARRTAPYDGVRWHRRPERARERGDAARVPRRRRRGRAPRLGAPARPAARAAAAGERRRHPTGGPGGGGGRRRPRRAHVLARRLRAGGGRSAGHRGLAGHRHPDRAVQPRQVRRRAGGPRDVGRRAASRSPSSGRRWCCSPRPAARSAATSSARSSTAPSARSRAPVARLLPLPLPGLQVGFVHADDVADALVRILDRRAAGPFNLTAEPVLDAGDSPAPSARVACPCRPSSSGRRCRRRSTPGWCPPSRAGSTSALRAPALDATRARTVLDWAPEHRGDEVLARVRRRPRPRRGRARAPAAAPRRRISPGVAPRLPEQRPRHGVAGVEQLVERAAQVGRRDGELLRLGRAGRREQRRAADQLLEERRGHALGAGEHVVEARGVDGEVAAVELEQRPPRGQRPAAPAPPPGPPGPAGRPARARAGRPGWW